LDTDLLTYDLNKFLNWANSNQLSVAIEKCSVLHVGRANPSSDFFLSGQLIPSVKSITDLGVDMSQDLKFSGHIGRIVSKAKKVVNLIFRIFTTRDPKVLVKLYKTLVRPILEYATEIWNPHYLKDINHIESVQRLFTRRIPACFDMQYHERLALLDLETLELRRLHMDLKMTYKILYNLVDLDVSDFFDLSAHPSTRTNTKKLRVPIFRLDCRKFFFSLRVINPWNDLPESVVNSTNMQSFTARLANVDLREYLKGGYQ
jgi:hypothetical protein